MSEQLAPLRQMQLMTKEQAGILTAQLEKQDIVLNGLGVSVASLVDEVAELGKQAPAASSVPGVDELEQAVADMKRLMEQVVAVLRYVRKRPMDWRLAAGLLLLGLCLGSVGTFSWVHAHPQVVIQQVPAARGK